jgi:hypothetical protein
MIPRLTPGVITPSVRAGIPDESTSAPEILNIMRRTPPNAPHRHLCRWPARSNARTSTRLSTQHAWRRAPQPALGARWSFITLEHGRSDLRTTGPLPSSLSRESLIIRQAFRVRLHDLAILQEQEAYFVGRHAVGECFGFVECGAQPQGDVLGVDWLAARQFASRLPGSWSCGGSPR